MLVQGRMEEFQTLSSGESAAAAKWLQSLSDYVQPRRG